MPGPEDMEILSLGGKDYLVVSSHERRIPGRTGQLKYWELSSQNLSRPGSVPLDLPVDKYPEDFRPHGISHSRKNGKLRIYAISHPSPSRHTIEVFEEAGGGKFLWRHVGTLADPLLESPNDLFALPEERLLVSNDGIGDRGFGFYVNYLFKRKTADITYYDGNAFYSTNEKLAFGNGIWYEEVGGEKTLYRASHLDRAIYVYSVRWVEKHGPLLQLQYKIPFPGGPDNLYKNEYGFVTAVHLSDFQFLDHSKDSRKLAPSSVYEIHAKNQSRILYADPGSQISAASTAIRYKDKLLVSQVFDDFILLCEI